MKNVLKKGLSLLLAITIIFSSAIVGLGEIDYSGLFVVEAKAVSKTVDEAMAWCESLRNVKVGTGECVALIKAYYEFLGVEPVSGHAYQFATNTLPSGWSRVAGGEPQAGDILVYTGAKYGHVAIYAGGSTSYHQNMSGRYVERKDSWPYYNSWYSKNEGGTKSYWGYIRPDFKTTPSETTPPVISGVAVRNSNTGYLVTCNVSDNVGVTEVLFPSWTDSNGQDDIIWHKGTLNADGKSAYCWIDASNHNNETGYYVTHIYAYDASGNSTNVGAPYVYVGNLIQWHGVSNPDNSDAGIDSSSSFTIKGKYKFWFKEYDVDTNYYVNVSLDGNQLLYNASSDANGYVSVVIDAADIPAGLHTLTADLYDSQAKYTVSKQFYSEIYDNQKPVISEAKVAIMAENGYTVTAKVSDNKGVTKVLFPTWIPGQSVATWLEGTYDPTYDHWACWVPVSNWNNHYGTYYTHVYAYDATGNETCYGMPDIHVPSVNANSENLASSGTYDLSKKSTIYAAGWAYNKNGDTVKLYHRFDNGAWTEFDLAERSDVQNTYSDCKQLKCGYYKNISISHLSEGQHTVDIIVSTNGMTKVIATKTFTVVRPDSYVYFDMNDGSSNNINLLAPKKATVTSGGITYSYDGATGIITLNGTATGNVDLFSKPFKAVNGEIYKVSATYVSGSVSNGCVVLEARDNDGNRMYFDTYNSNGNKTWTITSTQASKINRVDFWAWCNTSKGKLTFNNYKIKLKLEKVASSSASATTYTPNAKYLEYGQTYATMPAPTRTGYTFDGWYTAKTGGTKITASTVFSSGSAQTLYAHWTPNKYTVTYNANGGSGALSSQTKSYGTNLTLSSTIPTRTGYTFTGWNTKSDGTGTSYSAGGTYKANEAVTLYAQWRINTYIISFDANGGSGAPSSQTKSYGTNLTLSSTIPTRTGYTFKGWNTKADGTGTNYSAGGTYKANEAVTLYAQWVANTYSVTFDANGGSGAPSSQTKTYGTTLTLSSTIPSQTGYTFTGWNTKADGSGTTYSAGASYTANESVTLYAQWVNNLFEYTIENDCVTITKYIGVDMDVVVPDTIDGLPVTAIGTDAFRDCTGITSATIPDSVTSIGGSAFRGCTNLKEIELPDNITSIPGAMCYGCTKLETIVIPEGVVNIGGYAFSNCISLKNVVIPDSATNIGGSVFANCNSLVVNCGEGSSAKTYADTNSIAYIENTSNTSIDIITGIIYTDILGGDLSIIMSGSDTIKYSMNTSYAGTGAVVDVLKAGNIHSQYTLVVNGDTNGDSVCDVLDCFDVERTANSNADLSGVYAEAGDANGDGLIDIADYQAIVNKAIS